MSPRRRPNWASASRRCRDHWPGWSCRSGHRCSTASTAGCNSTATAGSCWSTLAAASTKCVRPLNVSLHCATRRLARCGWPSCIHRPADSCPTCCAGSVPRPRACSSNSFRDRHTRLRSGWPTVRPISRSPRRDPTVTPGECCTSNGCVWRCRGGIASPGGPGFGWPTPPTSRSWPCGRASACGCSPTNCAPTPASPRRWCSKPWRSRRWRAWSRPGSVSRSSRFPGLIAPNPAPRTSR